MIVETFYINGDNSDVLKAPSRLAAIPSGGVLTLEVSAEESSNSNNGKLSIRDAEGDVPIRECQIPANGVSDSNAVLHGSTEWVIAIPVEQGQHVGVDVDITGTTVVFIRATLKP